MCIPSWRECGKGYNDESKFKRHWMHVGGDVWYVALEEAKGPKVRRPYLNLVLIMLDLLLIIFKKLNKDYYKLDINKE